MNDENELAKGYEKFVKLLISKKLTITTMESCTGGMISSLITDTEGSSSVFKGSFVTYSNEAKIKLGVPSETIEKYSVYSKETALEMAKAAKRIYDSSISVGITGTMGNIDPENEKYSKQGNVYFAIINEDSENAYFVSVPKEKSRVEYKFFVAEKILEKLNALFQ